MTRSIIMSEMRRSPVHAMVAVTLAPGLSTRLICSAAGFWVGKGVEASHG